MTHKIIHNRNNLPQTITELFTLNKQVHDYNTRYRNEILANCQWINKKYVDFYKIEYCPYIREGEGRILGTFELKKSLKIDIFVSLCDYSANKRAGKRKILWIVENYTLSVGTG